MLLCGTRLLSLTKYTTVITELRREEYNYNAFKVYQKKIIERNESCFATGGSSCNI
jgi:hypothetical protein